MVGVAIDVQRALALQLDLSLAVDASLLRAVGTVGKGVLRAALRTDLDALLVGDVDSCAAGIGQRQAGQRDGALVGTAEGKLAVGAGAAELVGDLIAINGIGVALGNGDVGTADGGRHVLGHVASHGDACRCAVVGNAYGVIGHFRLVEINL